MINLVSMDKSNIRYGCWAVSWTLLLAKQLPLPTAPHLLFVEKFYLISSELHYATGQTFSYK